MATLYTLALAVCAVFSVASIFRLIALAIGMSLGGVEEKRQYLIKMKNTLIVFAISLLVGGTGGAIRALLSQYFT